MFQALELLTHVMPRDPVIVITGSLGILFWMKTLTRDTKVSSAS
jgi:hypothetical protein